MLSGKLCLDTGAASKNGIGFATAKLFAEQGARVALIDLEEAASRAAAARIGDSRLGEALDVARICLFLASELSSYTTGATIDVNGGMLIH